MTNNTQTHHLVVCALGTDRPGIINQISEVVLSSQCNIEDSRMTVLGSEFSLLMLVAGPWNAIAKLESQCGQIQQRLDLSIVTRRTEPREPSGKLLPYAVEVVAMDHPGIVNQMAGFFSDRGINIEDLITTSYAAAHTGTPMFSVNMSVGIPSDLHIAPLRQEFLEFCDDLNLDAVIEPIRS